MSEKICKQCHKGFELGHPKKIFCNNNCNKKFWDIEHQRQRKIALNTRSIVLNNCRLCQQQCKNFERSDPLCKPCKLKVLRRKEMNKSIKTEDILREDFDRKNRKVAHLDKYGYVMVPGLGHPNSEKGGRIREHILIVSNFLRRPLFEHENIHHKNGVRDDNRIENLELWSTSQPSGQRVEDKIQWCKEFLKQYGVKYIE